MHVSEELTILDTNNMSSELTIAIPGISEDLYASIVPSGLSYGLSSGDVSNGISLISQLGIEGFEVCT